MGSLTTIVGRSIRSREPIGQLSVLGLVLAWATALAQPPEPSITFEAESVALDLRRGVKVFHELSVTDGSISIRAAEGVTTAEEVRSGSVTFSGGVLVTVDGSTLRATSAVFRFAGGRLEMGELLGEPVAFETRRERDAQTFRGTAGHISYDGLERTLSASGGASFAYEGIEIENCSWTYDLDKESVYAQAEGEGTCLSRVATPRGR